MPTYEYQCDACGEKFEKFQSITSQPIRKCPLCGKSKARRLISTGAGLLFKGSGFYITDYRSSSYKAGASADSGAKPAEGKSDAKGSTSSTAPAASSAPAAPAPAAPAKSSSKDKK